MIIITKMQMRTRKGRSRGGTSKLASLTEVLWGLGQRWTLVPTASRLAAEGPTVGVQGFVMLLGKETPFSDPRNRFAA